jgi:hypothetical protein
MSQKIYRQSEQYAIFDAPAAPREARSDVPAQSLVMGYLRGPAVPAGQLGRHACKICHSKPDSEKCAECRARERAGSRLGFSERQADDGAPAALFNPMLFGPWHQHLNPHSMMLGAGEEPGDHWATAAAQDPGRSTTTTAALEKAAHGFAPGHRIGLPYRDTVIPGTVTHLNGGNVGVRWDDGQHSSENPWDIMPLK